MRAALILVAALGLTAAAPQLRFSGKSFIGLEQALGGRIPVAVSNANRIYHAYEDSDNNVVVVHLPGLTGGDSSYENSRDRSFENSRDRSYENSNSRSRSDERTDERFDDVFDDAFDALADIPVARSGLPVATALQAAETAGDAAEAQAEFEATVVQLRPLRRRKRQNDIDDFELTTADQASFALSSLGTLFGAHFGRWLDDTFEVNTKFIGRMERLGLLAVSQAENLLDTDSDEDDIFDLFR